MSPASKGRLRVAVVMLATLYLEVTFGANLRIWGVAPDLLCLVTVVAALVGGAEQGVVCGFGCGLLADLYLQDTPFGLSALSLCIVGFLVGWFRAASPSGSKALIPVAVLVGTAINGALFLGLAGMVGQSHVFDEGRTWLIRVVAIESIDNAVLALPMWWLLRRAARGTLGAATVGAAIAPAK